MNCPHCKKLIADSLIISEGSKLMRKKSKRVYTSDQGRKAALARWSKNKSSNNLK